MNPARLIAETVEESIDAKIEKASRGGQKTVTAVYCGKDADGKPYVQIPGADDTTPIRRMSVQADIGDTVTVTIENGMAVVDSNVSNPSASSSNLQAVEVKASKAQQTADEAVEKAARIERKTEAAMTQALEASNIAAEAQQVADAINQHFWDDDNGAHVTDVTQEEWTAAVEDNFSDLSTNKPYHNSLFNSLGMLFRSALNNLVAITRSAIAFYDGNGNQSANIVAEFGANGAQIGKDDEAHVEVTNQYISIMGGSSRYLKLGPMSWSSGVPTGGGVIYFNNSGGQYVLSDTTGSIQIGSDKDVTLYSGLRNSSTSGYNMRASVSVNKPTSGGSGNSDYAFSIRRTKSEGGSSSINEGILAVTYDGSISCVGTATFGSPLAVSSGGTGVSTATANRVFAAPNGSNGAPSFRQLVSADVSGLGTVVTGSDTVASVANTTATQICSVSLAPGTWVVTYTASFASNATGRRNIKLYAGTSTTIDPARSATCQAVNGSATVLSRTAVVTVSSTTSYYLNAYQASGGALSVDGDIQAIRIA